MIFNIPFYYCASALTVNDVLSTRSMALKCPEFLNSEYNVNNTCRDSIKPVVTAFLPLASTFSCGGDTGISKSKEMTCT